MGRWWMADADVRLEYMEFGVRKREVLRWQRWSWKEVETAFVMVSAKRITEDGEKGGEREREETRARFHTSFLHQASVRR